MGDKYLHVDEKKDVSAWSSRLAGNKNRVATLKSRADFSRIKSKGRTVSSNPWLLANYSKNEDLGLRVGWTIPGYVGSSVVRNRLKRWIRQYLQSISGEILNHQYDINLVFRKRSSNFYSELEHGELDVALNGIFKKISSTRS